jgi:hypothetical protein
LLVRGGVGRRVNSAHPEAHAIDISVDGPNPAMRQILRRLMAEERGARAAAD